MATIRKKIEERADNLLDQVFRLKQLKQRMEESAPDLLDLEMEGWITVSAYTHGGHISVAPGEDQDRDLPVRLLDMVDEDRVIKTETFSGGRRATFRFDGRIDVAVDRPNTTPCHEYKVRDKQVRTISVCGPVDTERYEILEELLVDYAALEEQLTEAA
jgi:hypothetical protein